jgi:hypothetical protein
VEVVEEFYALANLLLEKGDRLPWSEEQAELQIGSPCFGEDKMFL